MHPAQILRLTPVGEFRLNALADGSDNDTTVSLGIQHLKKGSPMSIRVSCDSCESQFRVDDQHAGKRVRCPQCQGVATVPSASPSRSAEAPPRSVRPPAERESRREMPARNSTRSRKPVSNRSSQESSTPWTMIAGAAAAVLLLGGGGIFLVRQLTGNDASADVASALTPGSVPPTTPVATATENADAALSSASAVATPVSEATATNSGGVAGAVGAAGVTPNGSTNPGSIPTTTAASGTTATAGTMASPAAMLPGIPAPIPSNSVATGNSVAGTMPALPPGTPAPTMASSPEAGSLPPSPVELNPADVFTRVKPAIVRVNVSTEDGEGHGSGFVLDNSGLVVTNYHVIAGGNQATLEFHDAQRIGIRGVVFMNPQKDIAILKFDPKQRAGSLVAIPLASQLPPQGTSVVAIGAPLGLDMSITEGIVSANRTAKELEAAIGLTGHDGTWVQTTAAISPGNSGGPLLNRLGEVVAMNTLALSGERAQALNFGVCCSDIRQALSEVGDVPLALNPLIAPPLKSERSSESGGRGRGEIVDVSGTPEGQKRLAELTKIQIEFDTIFQSDPLQVVPGAARAEIDSILEKLKIEESLISNEMAVLAVIIRMRLAGDKISIYVTSHIFAVDTSSSGPRLLKLWERTGNAGSTTVQALLNGKLPAAAKREIKVFFGKLKDDVMDARKAMAEASAPSTTPAPDAKK